MGSQRVGHDRATDTFTSLFNFFWMSDSQLSRLFFISETALGQLTGDTNVQVLNWLEAVSPTGVSLTYAPFLLMMLFGAGLLLLSVRRRRNRG